MQYENTRISALQWKHIVKSLFSEIDVLLETHEISVLSWICTYSLKMIFLDVKNRETIDLASTPYQFLFTICTVF